MRKDYKIEGIYILKIFLWRVNIIHFGAQVITVKSPTNFFLHESQRIPLVPVKIVLTIHK